MFSGFTSLAQAIAIPILVRNSSGVPVDPDGLPTFRVYGPAGLMANGTGTSTKADTGTITAATNASPIVVTSAAHGLTTGTQVTISGVAGNTSANGNWVVTRISATQFSLNGSVGNGAYTSGGIWLVTGFYLATITPQDADGFEPGELYSVLVSTTISSVAWAEQYTFVVA